MTLVQLKQCATRPASVIRILNSSWPATTLLPSSTSNSSMTPAPGDGTGIDVYKRQQPQQNHTLITM